MVSVPATAVYRCAETRACGLAFQTTRRRRAASRQRLNPQAVAEKAAATQKKPFVLTEVTQLERRTYVINDTALTRVDTASAEHRSDAGAAASSSAPAEEQGRPLGSQLTRRLQALLLPRGYPGSVTDDYLEYQLWALPTHVTGWMSHSLVTSNLLLAVGLGSAGAAGAVGATAAIKWVTKDGIGALGRLLVGGRLSGVFDEDPKRWRIVAEGVTTSGLALEIATGLFPSSFLLLASAGNFAKAFGKGMGRPAFRVIQTHFAATGNIGDVAAKEEVWEVAGQLGGLAASVALLRALEASSGGGEAVIYVWLAVHALHVALRVRTLSSLRFSFPNQKRAAALATAHVQGRSVPDVAEANAAENLFIDPALASPSLRYGVTLAEAIASPSGGGRAAGVELGELLPLYEGERYVLAWREARGAVLLRQDASSRDFLRAMWQAAWLTDAGIQTATAAEHAASLRALAARYDDFEACAAAAGWDTSGTRVPAGDVRLVDGGMAGV